jgi:hypothetical protein
MPGETETDSERERQTARERDRQRERETARERDRHRERERERERETDRERGTDRERVTDRERGTDRQTRRETEKRDRQRDSMSAKSHPTYAAMANKAVLNIKSISKGASLPAIKTCIATTWSIECNAAALRAALKKTVESGALSKDGARYKLSSEQRAAARAKPKKNAATKKSASTSPDKGTPDRQGGRQTGRETDR